MLINAILYTFSDDNVDQAMELLRGLRDATRMEPGCIRYEVARSVQNPNVFALIEEYVDETALQAHLASDAFQSLGINGIRKLSVDRIGHTCRPID